MPSLKSTENFLEFYIPRVNTSCRTWYKIFNPESDSVPLVVLHGGPGIPHDAVLPISEISWTQNIPVIMYDQIGCGSSSRFPEKMGDGDFWTVDLFLDELDALLTSLGIHERYDLLGHSWGGMIAACHAIKQPHGLRKLVIADSPADMKDWVKAVNHLRAKLPLDVQQALEQCEKDGNIDSDEFEAAAEVYNERHVCRVSPLPEELGRAIRSMKADPTVMLTMNGPSEFLITGTLKDWTIVDRIHRIKVPTLLINGRYDEARDEVMEPFFRLIEKVKWVRFADSSHMPHFEEKDEFLKVVGDFLMI